MKNRFTVKTVNMNTTSLNWKKIKMSEYLDIHVGEGWIDFFNVEDYFYLLEYLDGD
jgi:hypothetical protein